MVGLFDIDIMGYTEWFSYGPFHKFHVYIHDMQFNIEYP